MQGFTNIDLAVLVIYLIAVLLFGVHFAKKDMKGKEYFKGDGTIPWWVTSVSIFATLLVRPAGHAAGNSTDYPVFPADLQQAGY